MFEKHASKMVENSIRHGWKKLKSDEELKVYLIIFLVRYYSRNYYLRKGSSIYNSDIIHGPVSVWEETG